jgi:cytochrome c oxidase subunit II
VLLGVAVVVSVGVTLLLLWATHRSRQRSRGAAVGQVNGRALVWIAGGIVTPAVVLALTVHSYRVGASVYTPLDPAGDVLTVEVVGHQFWWEVRYPAYGVSSANELHIPAGRSVRVLLRAEDVIHSFWVPQLQGKLDMIPGHTTELWIEADEPGLFRGQCAEYCGMSHALMALWVIAHPQSEFEAWIARRSTPTAEPADPLVQRGRDVFFDAECHLCHATRAWPTPSAEGGTPGPDLTHVASRRSLAAGTLPNNRGSLAGWIADPQRLKPGVRMPPTHLPPEELRALLAYLESLE